MRVGLTVMAVLAMATVANAAVLVSVVPQASPGAGLEAYKLVFSGERVTSVVGRLDGNMNQVWYLNVLATPNLDNANLLGADIVKDTHLLFLNADTIPLRGPTEDGPGTGSYLASDSGTTTFSFGLKAALQTDPRDFAWVVIPTGGQVAVNLSLTTVETPQAAQYPEIVIPEPLTLSLLGLGGLALLRRRR